MATDCRCHRFPGGVSGLTPVSTPVGPGTPFHGAPIRRGYAQWAFARRGGRAPQVEAMLGAPTSVSETVPGLRGADARHALRSPVSKNKYQRRNRKTPQFADTTTLIDASRLLKK